MAAFTNYIISTDRYLTMGDDMNVLDQGETTYTFPKTQNKLTVYNGGSATAIISVGGFKHLVIHPNDTFEQVFDFDEVIVSAPYGAVSLYATTKDFNTMPVMESDYYYLENLRAKGSTGMVIDGANKTTSAATINAGIAGVNKKYEITYACNFEATGGTKHTWFNGVCPVVVTTDSVAGIVKSEYDYVTFEAGDGGVFLTLTGTWVAGEVITITIEGGTQLGYTVSDKVITDTLAA